MVCMANTLTALIPLLKDTLNAIQNWEFQQGSFLAAVQDHPNCRCVIEFIPLPQTELRRMKWIAK